LHSDDLARFKTLGVIASMQPYHCSRPEAGYLPSWLRFVGEARYEDSFPWQRLREAGAHLTFGSDWPVVSLNPFLGIHAAVTRKVWKTGQLPQAQSLEQTLAAYTKDGAFVEFQEHEKGQLKTGMLADLALLSADMFSLPTTDLAKLTAELTLCGGQIVYQA
jgi:hypothetical protein